MKKQLLISGALLYAMSATSQNKAAIPQSNGIVNMAEKLASKFNVAFSEDISGSNMAKQGPDKTVVSSDNSVNSSDAASSPIISSVFTRLSGSMNLLGMIVSSSKPLHYNNEINTVAFIQRKSSTYQAAPIGNSNSGTIVGYFSKDFGTTWDSTCIWANATNLARYPQGGIYNPAGNQNPDNAYLIGTGPITQGSGWLGSWYASKKIGAVGTNSPSADQQFMSHTTPFGSLISPTMPKHYFPRHGFCSTDDGLVRSLGGLYDEYGIVNAGQPEKYRGTIVAKGSFVSGAMVWTADSLVPPTVSITTGGRQLFSQNWMAWNEQGTVGYVMFIGGRQGSTGSNFGWQPIIYKTTNSGNTWALTNGIDFNTPGWQFIKNSMATVNTNTALEIPFFNVGEGIDITVDKNNDLHIVTTVVGTARNHPDSMGYTYQFTKGTENYSWPYVNTAWPYIFDFIGDGNNWTYRTIDSVGTEGPGATSGSNGFSSNPWTNASQTTAVSPDMRIQVSRTYDGEFVLYSWAESDTTLTTAAVKWNEFPNIKQRAMRVCDKVVSTDEYAVTSPGSGFNPRVRDKSYFHYMSPECMAGGVITPATAILATFTVPYTVSNNLSYDGAIPVDNFVGRAIVSHSFAMSTSTACNIFTSIGINSNEVTQSNIYPNPAKNNFNVVIQLSVSKEVFVEVFNAIGQKVAASIYNGQIGTNTIPVQVNNANAGVYFVKVKAGNNETTKKLILE